MMLAAVFFDLDGTLADTERQNAESVARALGKRGRRVTDEERHFVIGHGWAEIHHHLSENSPLDVSLPELMSLVAWERERLVAEEGLLILPGAVELIRQVGRRVPTAVVSGSSRAEIAFCLQTLGVSEVFRFFVGAEDTGRGKPHPDGYLLAARRLEAAPARCVVLEDSAAGIRAAKAAGMRCIAVRAGNFARQPQEEADLIVETLLEVDVDRLAKLVDGPYNSGEQSGPG